MKILMIAPQPFFEPRGTPISVYTRLQALSVLGHQVDLLTYHVGQDVSIPEVVVHRGLRVPFIKKVKPGPSWQKVILDVLLFFQAAVLLAGNRYDAIHSHEEAAFFSIILSKVFHTRHIYDMHSSLPRQLASMPRWRFWPFLKLFEILERWVIHTCDAVIAIGVDLEERVRAIKPDAKSVVIHNLAVVTDDSGSNHRSVRRLQAEMRLGGKLPVVYTGTFERYQGLDLLLQSAKLVREQCPEISFIMVGGTPQQVEHWRHLSIAGGLEDSVLFTGTVPPAEAIAYLKMAEILVSPRTEGTSVPLKIFTYLHSGKPIVATDVMAHTQVLDSRVAVLVAPTEEAFADGILALARSPELRKTLGLRAQQLARERCDPAEYLTRLDRVYRELDLATHSSEQAAHSPQSGQAGSAHRQWYHLP